MDHCPKCGRRHPGPVAACPDCGHSFSESTPTSAPPTSGPHASNPPDAGAATGAPLVIGDIVGGRYRLDALVGRGAMGEVYRAQDLKLGQAVALKFLPTRVAGNAAALQRFVSEVRLGRQVSHPNVCRLHDLVEIDGRHALSMEFIEGEDLASCIERKGRLTAAELRALALDLCAGLAAAHERGVVHRDLKPANVLVDASGHAHIADFGIAALADESDPRELAGTYSYMAPELVFGQPAGVRSDLYALGLVLEEAGSGKRRHRARDFDELKALHAGGEHPPIAPGLPKDVARLAAACLQRDPARRPASANAARAILEGGRRRTLLLAAAAVALLALGLGLYGWQRERAAAMAAAAARLGPASAAVLPFVNMTGDRAKDYFADGMTETLLDRLAQVPQLKIAARTSSFAFKGKLQDIPSIGAALGVATVVEGSVQQQGSTLRITAQLIRVADGAHLWSQQYDRPSKDLFAIQDEIASSVSAALAGHLLPGGKAALARQGTHDLKAYEDYVKGRQALARLDLPSFELAEKLFTDAVTRDPEYVPAMLELVQSWGWLEQYGELTVTGFQQRAVPMLDRVESLDPGNPRLLSMRAWVAQTRGDGALAQRLATRAVAAAPGDYGIRMNAAGVYFNTGKLPEALAQYDEMIALSPLDPYAHGLRAVVLLQLQRKAEAEVSARRALALDPGNVSASSTMTAIAAMAGDPAGAIVWQLKAYPWHRDYQSAAWIADQHLQIGDLDGARAWLEESRRQKPESNEMADAIDMNLAFIRGDNRKTLALADRLLVPGKALDFHLSDYIDTACAAAREQGSLPAMRRRLVDLGVVPPALDVASFDAWSVNQDRKLKYEELYTVGNCVSATDGSEKERTRAMKALADHVLGADWAKAPENKNLYGMLDGDVDAVVAQLAEWKTAPSFMLELEAKRMGRADDPRIRAALARLREREAPMRESLQAKLAREKLSGLPPPARTGSAG